MKTEITDFIEKVGAVQLSDAADALLNELTLVHSTIEEAFKELGGLSSLKGSVSLEMKASTEVIQELAEKSEQHIFTPSDFSPYHWMMLSQDIEGSDESIRITIQGTKWEVSQAWKDTQTH